jgi:hypothetical protein
VLGGKYTALRGLTSLRGIKVKRPPGPHSASAREPKRSIRMLDILLVALGIALFGLTVGYAYACDWL